MNRNQFRLAHTQHVRSHSCTNRVQSYNLQPFPHVRRGVAFSLAPNKNSSIGFLPAGKRSTQKLRYNYVWYCEVPLYGHFRALQCQLQGLFSILSVTPERQLYRKNHLYLIFCVFFLSILFRVTKIDINFMFFC